MGKQQNVGKVQMGFVYALHKLLQPILMIVASSSKQYIIHSIPCRTSNTWSDSVHPAIQHPRHTTLSCQWAPYIHEAEKSRSADRYLSISHDV